MGCDVLIVGAGPTGLVLALWLTKLGVKVRIIDKTAEAGTTSRALAVQARTLELYRQLDLAKPWWNARQAGAPGSLRGASRTGSWNGPFPCCSVSRNCEQRRSRADSFGKTSVLIRCQAARQLDPAADPF